jgi:hypothetical protein
MSAVRDPIDPVPTARAPRTRSRVANGSGLLPSVDGRSTWGRLFRDVVESLESHVGGANRQAEPERLISRRVATLEAELVAMESRFAQLRGKGDAPTMGDLDLYSRLSNTQRRHLEALGIQRRPRDLVPDLSSYIEGKAA